MGDFPLDCSSSSFGCSTMAEKSTRDNTDTASRHIFDDEELNPNGALSFLQEHDVRTQHKGQTQTLRFFLIQHKGQTHTLRFLHAFWMMNFQWRPKPNDKILSFRLGPNLGSEEGIDWDISWLIISCTCGISLAPLFEIVLGHKLSMPSSMPPLYPHNRQIALDDSFLMDVDGRNGGLRAAALDALDVTVDGPQNADVNTIAHNHGQKNDGITKTRVEESKTPLKHEEY